MPSPKEFFASDDFKNLSPEAKKVAFDRVTAKDPDFQSLAPEAQAVARERAYKSFGAQAAPSEAPAAEEPKKGLLQRAREGASDAVSSVASFLGRDLNKEAAIRKNPQDKALAQEYRKEQNQWSRDQLNAGADVGKGIVQAPFNVAGTVVAAGDNALSNLLYGDDKGSSWERGRKLGSDIVEGTLGKLQNMAFGPKSEAPREGIISTPVQALGKVIGGAIEGTSDITGIERPALETTLDAAGLGAIGKARGAASALAKTEAGAATLDKLANATGVLKDMSSRTLNSIPVLNKAGAAFRGLSNIVQDARLQTALQDLQGLMTGEKPLESFGQGLKDIVQGKVAKEQAASVAAQRASKAAELRQARGDLQTANKASQEAYRAQAEAPMQAATKPTDNFEVGSEISSDVAKAVEDAKAARRDEYQAAESEAMKGAEDRIAQNTPDASPDWRQTPEAQAFKKQWEEAAASGNLTKSQAAAVQKQLTEIFDAETPLTPEGLRAKEREFATPAKYGQQLAGEAAMDATLAKQVKSSFSQALEPYLQLGEVKKRYSDVTKEIEGMTEGAAGKAAEGALTADKVGSTFFGTRAGAQQLKTTLGDAKAAEYAGRHLDNVLSGKDPLKAADWVNKQEWLKEFPEVRAKAMSKLEEGALNDLKVSAAEMAVKSSSQQLKAAQERMAKAKAEAAKPVTPKVSESMQKALDDISANGYTVDSANVLGQLLNKSSDAQVRAMAEHIKQSPVAMEALPGALKQHFADPVAWKNGPQRAFDRAHNYIAAFEKNGLLSAEAAAGIKAKIEGVYNVSPGVKVRSTAPGKMRKALSVAMSDGVAKGILATSGIRGEDGSTTDSP